MLACEELPVTCVLDVPERSHGKQEQPRGMPATHGAAIRFIALDSYCCEDGFLLVLKYYLDTELS